MRSLSTDELRQAYIDFFVQKHSHAEISGASLIPENDPTVLFTTAGMHPLVPYLLGERHPAGQCLVSCQRCVRTQDIDEVGDGSHLTFFEMLGNWSIGDAAAADGIGRSGYFKEGAIRMSFQFLTEVLELPKNKLAVTCFAGDDDAPRDDASARVWEALGIPRERIGFLPKAKNWWGPAGHTGPCGPDTEMFFWIGPSELPPPGSNPANDEKNWLEMWNDVFMEYERREAPHPPPVPNGYVRAGNPLPRGEGLFAFVPLRQKNVDTGMGLERVAQVLQGVASVYETDELRPLMQAVEKLERSFPLPGYQKNLSLQEKKHHERIITDHVRAAVFIIGDGVMPSNVDRGYVLRRLIRRAIRSMRHVGSDGLVSCIAVEVIEQYKKIKRYGFLEKMGPDITAVLDAEETQFGNTLKEGLKHFSKVTSNQPFGLELRAERQPATSNQIAGAMAFHLFDTYGFPIELTKELAAEQGSTVDEAGFAKAFAEHQKLSRAGAEKRFAGGLADHSAATTKLHTATHLLNAALRKVLGPHVQQKGSNITAERLRFDFSHPAKVTPEQLAEAEHLVNEAISADLPVACHLTTVEGAKNEGAIGVFDRKYEQITQEKKEDEGPERSRGVKVYVIGPKECHGEPAWPAGRPVEPPFSIEICGGPHVARTGMLGHFTIQKEEAVSSGVRRIRAVVSGGSQEIATASGS